MNNMPDVIADNFTTNKFPWKLWRIVNDCLTGAIGWGEDGKTIVVHKAQFQREYLDAPTKLFKTCNIGSFIRQLNLYGFKKVQPPTRQYIYDVGCDQDIQEFQSDCFVRDSPDLVHELRRHVGVRRAREQAAKRRFAGCSLSESLGGGSVRTSRSQRNDVIRIDHPRHPPGYGKDYARRYREQYTHPKPDTNPPAKRPCMLAVPIYADGLPYISQQVPPVLVEWDTRVKEWVATAPPIDVPGKSSRAASVAAAAKAESSAASAVVKRHETTGGDRGGALSGLSPKDFGLLVNAVSDALIHNTPDQQRQPYLRDRHHYQRETGPSRGCDTPSSMDSFSSMTTECDDVPEMPPPPPRPTIQQVPKRVYKPGESLLRVIKPPNPSSRYAPNQSGAVDYSKKAGPTRYRPLATLTHDGNPNSTATMRNYQRTPAIFTPRRHNSVHKLSPQLKNRTTAGATAGASAVAVSLPSPITSRDVSFCEVNEPHLLSPMSVKCEDEAFSMFSDLSPMQQQQHDDQQNMSFTSAVCGDESLQMPFQDTENPFDPMSIL